MEHTKEPWIIDGREELATNFYSGDATGAIIGGCPHYKFAPRSLEERKANVRRIVACVNACVEVDTSTLESIAGKGLFSLAIDAVNEREEIKLERDALLVDRDNWCEDARALRESQERLWKQRDELRATLKGLLAIVEDSQGVSGYHRNGDIAEWDEFPEIEAARTAILNAKGGGV